MEEYLRQLSDLSGVILVLSPLYYSLFIICRVAGKKLGEYEHNKFIDSLSERFYQGAKTGVIETWCFSDRNSVRDTQIILGKLFNSKIHKKDMGFNGY